MRSSRFHIILFLLFAGVLSSSLANPELSSQSKFIIDCDPEEIIEGAEELNSEKDDSKYKLDAGDDGPILCDSLRQTLLFFNRPLEIKCLSKRFLKATPLFILYCMLKVDC